jgi:hypothetical protein
VAAALALMGCAGLAKPKPAFYPNPYYQKTSEADRMSDIADCESLADQYVQTHAGKKTAEDVAGAAAGGALLGVVGGAISGNIGEAAALGAGVGATAGLIKGVFDASEPSPNYKQFVNRCLDRKGYEVYGWSTDS